MSISSSCDNDTENLAGYENGLLKTMSAELVVLTGDETMIGDSGCGGFPLPMTL
jgi:hypothetical protein